MASIAFQGLGPAVTLVDPPAAHPRRGMWLAVSQTMCGWRRSGHEMILKTEGSRLYLQCRLCLRETPGWAVAKGRPTTR